MALPAMPRPVQSVVHALKHALMWNSVLRTFLMMYLGIATEGCTNIAQTDWSINAASGIGSIIVFICMIIFSFWVTRFLLKNISKLPNDDFQKSYLAIYTNLEYDGKPESLKYTGFMLQRRLVLAFTIGFLTSSTVL